MRNRKREARDYYKTPPECIELIRDDVYSAWDCAAGNGVFQNVLGKEKVIYSSDICPMSFSVIKMDYLEETALPNDNVEMVVVNPPWSLANEFIEHTIFHLEIEMWALVRLEWMSTKQNRKFQNHVKELRIISELVKFETKEGRIVNGNGTMRVGWFHFMPFEYDDKSLSWEYYD